LNKLILVYATNSDGLPSIFYAIITLYFS